MEPWDAVFIQKKVAATEAKAKELFGEGNYIRIFVPLGQIKKVRGQDKDVVTLGESMGAILGTF